MNKLTINKTNPEWLEATWVEETTTQVEVEKEVQVEKEVEGELVTVTEMVKELEDRVEKKVLWCESYSGHREHIEMLRARALEFDTTINEEDEALIKEVSEAFVYPDEEVLAQEKEATRILCINSKANEIITTKYPLYKQNNITLLLMPYTEQDRLDMCAFIESVRAIAKESKDSGVTYDNINWLGLDK